MANSNLPRSWEEFYVGFAQIPSEHGGRRIYRIKSILKHCAPPPIVGSCTRLSITRALKTILH